MTIQARAEQLLEQHAADGWDGLDSYEAAALIRSLLAELASQPPHAEEFIAAIDTMRREGGFRYPQFTVEYPELDAIYERAKAQPKP